VNKDSDDFEASGNYVKAFKQFSTDLLCLEPTFVSKGVSGASTFGVGYLMALINQQVWKIRMDGFERATRVPSSKMTEAYHVLLKKLEYDPDNYIFSNIFTSQFNISIPYSVTSDLSTEIQTMEIWGKDAPAVINSQIAIQTFGKIWGTLVPEAGWYGPGIESYTKAVFTNTFYYSNKWRSPLVDIGTLDFTGEGKVPFLEYNENVGFYETMKYSLYSVPVQGDKKSVVFLLPKTSHSDFLLEFVKDTFQLLPSDLRNKNVNLQFPAMNFTIPTSYTSQLKKLGIRKTFCNKSPKEENFMQKISQQIHIAINADKVEFAAATGVDLNNYKEYSEKFNILPTDDFFTESETCLDCSCMDDKKRTIVYNKSTQVSDHVRVDSPFFWYLNDEQIGPMFFGFVSSIKDYDTYSAYKMNSTSTTLDGTEEYSHWACG
jgi:hypothetical protein